MAYLTMEADIDHGRIIPKEPEKLPATGKALLTILESAEPKPDWDKVMSLLGTMQNRVDGLAYEREVRAEWDEREHKEWRDPSEHRTPSSRRRPWPIRPTS